MLILKQVYPILALSMALVSLYFLIVIKTMSKIKLDIKKISSTNVIVSVLICLTIFISGFFWGSFVKWLFCTIWAINFFNVYDAFTLFVEEIKLKKGFNYSFCSQFLIIFILLVGYFFIFLFDWLIISYSTY